MVSYSSIGNSLHALVLVNMVVYGSSIYRFGSYGTGVFDDEWLKRGFCTSHENFDGQTTHDYSGYAMATIALLGIALQRTLSSKSRVDVSTADSMVFWALMGALGHAWGHLFIAYGIKREFYPPAEQTFLDDLKNSTLLGGVGKVAPGYPLFWMPLVGTYMQNTAKGRVALVALIFNIGSLFMQVRFGFSYTQAVLFAGMSMDQLMLPKEKKGFEYAMWPLITTLPNAVLGWVEATSCTTSPLMQQHGHVIYDMYMASSYLVFYWICWLRANYSVKAKQL